MAEIRINCAAAGDAEVATWNKLTPSTTVSNLNTITGLSTPVSVSTTAWINSSEGRPNGLWPDAVWQPMFWNTAPMSFTISGLTPNTSYTIYYFCSTWWDSDREGTAITLVGSSSVGPIQINPELNTATEINGVVNSDGAGQIVIDVDSYIGAYKYCGGLRIVGDIPVDVGVNSVNSGNPIIPGQNVAVDMSAGGNNVTQIKLVAGTVEVIQNNLVITDDTTVSFDVVQGDLPFGAVTCVVTSGGELSRATTLDPIALNSYITVESPIVDDPVFLSVFDNGGLPAPVDGNLLEWVLLSGNLLAVDVQKTGIASISGGTGSDTIVIREWIFGTETWNAWTTLTVNTGTFNAAPVVVPPTTLPIVLPLGSTSLPKNDPVLAAWLLTASVSDDVDVGLTVSADISSLPDPIPADTYIIPFASTADSEGQIGTATALLVITIATINTAPVVSAPGNTLITFPYGGGGLSQTDSTLVAWLSAAVVIDDSDVLTATADLTEFAGNIPAGPHSIDFNAIDSEGLTGSDSSTITVVEGVQPNTAPVVTAPEDITITFPYGAGGLSQTNSLLLAWLPTSVVIDDNDNLTATADLTEFAGNIPVGPHTIVFNTVDSEGLTGSDSSTLTVVEGSPVVSVVYSPSWKVVKLGGDKHETKIYSGRANVLRLSLSNDGEVYGALISTTRMVFNLYDSGMSIQILDSLVDPILFDWSVGYGNVHIYPGSLDLIDGDTYKGELIVYNSSHVSGLTWIDLDDFEIEGA